MAQAVEEAAHAAARRGACDTAGDLAELAVAVTPLARIEARQRRVVLAAEQRFASSDPARACSCSKRSSHSPSWPGRAEVIRRLARYRAFRESRLPPGRPGCRTRWRKPARSGLACCDHARSGGAAISAGNYATRGGTACWRRDPRNRRQRRTSRAMPCGADVRGVHDRRRCAEGPDQPGPGRPEQPPALSVEKRPNVAVGHVLHWAGDLAGARTCYEQEYARAVAEGVETQPPAPAVGHGGERGLGG